MLQNLGFNQDTYNTAMLSARQYTTGSGMPATYPAHWVRTFTLRDGVAVTLRPIRPEDAAIEADFVRNLSDESRYYRFMDHLRELPPKMLSHFTEVDYHDHMALIATVDDQSAEFQIGVARYVLIPGTLQCEFALAVADAWQRRGVGKLLMQQLIEAARARGLQSMYGEVLSGNSKMLGLMQNLGFKSSFDLNEMSMIRVEKSLD
jgi:acetyltransferase